MREYCLQKWQSLLKSQISWELFNSYSKSYYIKKIIIKRANLTIFENNKAYLKNERENKDR